MKTGERNTEEWFMILLWVYLDFHRVEENASGIMFRDDERKSATLNTPVSRFCKIPISITIIHRGFTGHKHRTEFGLINMNGRVTDPLPAGMLSPDNNVQLPGYTRNFDRYAYALNNPLVYTDPDGAWFIKVLFDNISVYEQWTRFLNK